MKRTALLLLLAAWGCDGAPDQPSAGVKIAGRELEALAFCSGVDRSRVPNFLNPLDDGKAAVVGYATERHIHLYGETAPGDFDIAFVGRDGKITETAFFDRGKFLPVPPYPWKTQVGVTSTRPARYAVILRPGWLKKNGVEAGAEVSFTGTLAERKPDPLPVLEVGDRKVCLEFALDNAQRQRGLMHRPHLSRSDGMLFAYLREKTRTFWMRHTLIPLDIAFLSEDGRILNVVETDMLRNPATDEVPAGSGPSSKGEARYVLEVNYGWFRANGLLDESGKIREGIRVEIPDIAKAAQP